MEKWNGVVLDINTTCASLGQALYSQLLGAHTLSGCDTVLFPFGKGKISKRRQLLRVAWWGGYHAGGSHGNSSSQRYTDILQAYFQKSPNGIVFVETNGSRINIKHKVNTISLMDRILWPIATTYILHIVHHAGSENEILKYILIAQLDMQCLYVQLHCQWLTNPNPNRQSGGQTVYIQELHWFSCCCVPNIIQIGYTIAEILKFEILWKHWNTHTQLPVSTQLLSTK